MHLVFGGISVLLSVVKQIDEFTVLVVDGVSGGIVVTSIILILIKSIVLVSIKSILFESKA